MLCTIIFMTFRIHEFAWEKITKWGTTPEEQGYVTNIPLTTCNFSILRTLEQRAPA
jgi:hypothetical protein